MTAKSTITRYIPCGIMVLLGIGFFCWVVSSEKIPGTEARVFMLRMEFALLFLNACLLRIVRGQESIGCLTRGWLWWCIGHCVVPSFEGLL